jgi:hypothetical protein
LSRPASPPTFLTPCRGATMPLSQRPRTRPDRTQPCPARLPERCRVQLPERCRVQLPERCRVQLPRPCRVQLPLSPPAAPLGFPIKRRGDMAPLSQHARPLGLPIKRRRDTALPGQHASPRWFPARSCRTVAPSSLRPRSGHWASLPPFHLVVDGLPSRPRRPAPPPASAQASLRCRQARPRPRLSRRGRPYWLPPRGSGHNGGRAGRTRPGGTRPGGVSGFLS